MLNGLEVLYASKDLASKWGRCALLCNQASVDKYFNPSWQLMSQILGQKLVCLFGPQHGIESTVQDNMIETNHSIHPVLNIPIYSLYSSTREPTAEMLQDVDTIIVDLQHVGTRVYTYKYTLSACLRAARKLNKKVVVLDRPNPLGGILVEGNVLDLALQSFVGEFAIPIRHALTIGEIALFFNQFINADLEIIKMQDWIPSSIWSDLQRHWLLTSPNLSCIDSVYLYPGMVLFEGTNISEGRGTTLPFQFIGAPFVKPKNVYNIIDIVNKYLSNSQGYYLRVAQFQPWYQKWAGQICNGVQVHVIDAHVLSSYYLGLVLLRAFIELILDQGFEWKQPPYEYNFDILPIKLISGIKNFDNIIMDSSFDLKHSLWSLGIEDYIYNAKSILLYKRQLRHNL